MRIRHIEIFYSVYRYKTISAAARRLNISQPAVSKALRHAEDQLGFSLFIRTGQGLVPTDQAHILFEEVSKVYAGLTRVQQASKDLQKTLSGKLKISTVTGLSYEIVPRAIIKTRKSYPETAFELQTLHYGDLIASLREFDTHIGLVFEAPTHKGLVRKLMGAGRFCCVYQNNKTNPDFSDQGITIKQIAERDTILLNPTGPLGGKLWDEINNGKNDFDAVVIAESSFVAKSLAASGVGACIVDEFTAKAPGFPNLEWANLTPHIMFDVHALYLQSRPLSKVAKAFLRNFKSELKLWATR